jgi:hypothetical protein
MVRSVDLDVFSPGKKETLVCDIVLATKDSCHNVVFQCDRFTLNICLKDIVDMEEFHNLLSGSSKRNILHCTMLMAGKDYKGLRKVVSRPDGISVSLGGIRVGIPQETGAVLKDLITALKAKQ